MLQRFGEGSEMSALIAALSATSSLEVVKMFSSGVTLAIAIFTATKKTGRRK
jgi:hypothetical protein